MPLATGHSTWCVLVVWDREEPWEPLWDFPLVIFHSLCPTWSSLENFELGNGAMRQKLW